MHHNKLLYFRETGYRFCFTQNETSTAGQLSSEDRGGQYNEKTPYSLVSVLHLKDILIKLFFFELAF